MKVQCLAFPDLLAVFPSFADSEFPLDFVAVVPTVLLMVASTPGCFHFAGTPGYIMASVSPRLLTVPSSIQNVKNYTL